MKTAITNLLICLLLFSAGSLLFSSPGVEPVTAEKTAVPEGMNSWEVDTSPVTLSLFMDGPRSFIQRAWGRDPVSKQWIKDTGVDIDWTFAPDNSGKMFNIIIASGDFPDIMCVGGGLPERKKLAENGLIWDLQELSEMYAPGFWEDMWKDNKKTIVATRIMFESMGFYQTPAGHLPDKYADSPYVLRNASGTTVIDKIYEAVGSPKVVSGEDYLNLLRAVKKQFPEMTPMQSQRQSSPTTFGSPRLIDNLVNHAGMAEWFFEKDGKWTTYWEHPDFIKVLNYANVLYTEGLINPTEFTDQQSDLKARLSAGKIFSELKQDSDNLAQYNNRLAKNRPEWEFNFIKPFVLEPSMTYKSDTLEGGTGNARNMVSKQTEHPDRAIRWLDYIHQDQAQKEIFFGIEGHGHVMKDGIPVLTPEGAAAWEAGEEVHQDQFGMNYLWIFRDDYWQKVFTMSTAPPIVAKAYEITNASYSDLSFTRKGSFNFPNDSEEVKIWSVLTDYYQTEILKVISAAPSDVEAEWNTLLAKMQELGLPTLNDFWTEHFTNKKVLQEKYSADM